MKRPALCAGGPAMVLLAVAAVAGQETARRGGGTEAGGPYPRIPGAVTRAPEGLGSTPFNFETFFAAPPRDQNAARLYLDAIFEFSGEMEICFPEGTERERRRRTVADRSKRYQALDEALYKDPKAVSGTAIDDVVKLYNTGFQKLAEAQRHERCVFETGIGFDALFPHAQAARQVVRVMSLKIRRASEKKDFEAAIRDVASELRLARDLQPRGGAIAQLVSTAITQIICVQIPQIVLAPGARTEHCDRLIKLMIQHESKMTNGYVEMLRAEYLSARVAIRDLTRHQAELGKRLGVKPGDSVTQAYAKSLFGPVPPDKRLPFPDDVDALLTRTTNTELQRKIRELDRFYSALLSMDGVPYAERVVKAKALKLTDGVDALSQIMFMTTPGTEPFMRATARATASFHATECLVALRRWQLAGHRGAPADMASLVGAAGLRAVPTDPYNGKLMRLATLDGQPIVYAVGSDGKDDGGQKDSDRDQRPTGDVIYRLPAPTAPAAGR